jgi:hypothetical protein
MFKIVGNNKAKISRETLMKKFLEIVDEKHPAICECPNSGKA